MTVQRRRNGLSVIIYPEHLTTDRRGNHVLMVDMEQPIPTRAWVMPQRSAKAEVPGQAVIDVTRLGMSVLQCPEGYEVGLLSQVAFMGELWDVVTPPAYHHGTRGTRHWSIDIRRRP